MKRLAALLIALFLLGALSFALAEDQPETLSGYFERETYIREKPESSDVWLAKIPPLSPVRLTPIDDRYAAITYGDVEGYIFYQGFKSMPEETPEEEFTVYLSGNKYFYDAPLHNANILLVMQAETPMTVVASVRNYYHVTAGELDGYVFKTDCTVLTEFKSKPADAEFYVSEETALREYPLKNAQALAMLEPGYIYQATATSRDFYQVTADGVTGWVPIAGTSTFKADASTSRVALMHDGVALYTRPDRNFPAETAYAGGERLLFISAENSGFYRLAEEDLYLWHEDVETFVVNPIAMQQLFVSMDVALSLRPTGEAPAGVTLSAGELYAAQFAFGDTYLVYANDLWGFLPKSNASVSNLEAGEVMNRTAALITTNAVLYGDDGRRTSLSAGSKVFLTAIGQDFYHCFSGAQSGYVFKSAVEIVGADAPLTPYTVVLPKDTRLMDFPDRQASSCIILSEGETVEVDGFNRCYLRVNYKGQIGYCAQDGLVTAESEGIPATENVPSYQVALDKSTFSAYVFLLDDDGNPSAVVISAKVGIGKRTTPTPSGTFTLGVKERWHAFTYSVTPHTTTYVKARFIHGIPCRTRDESTKINYMDRYGMVTGGCLRSPLEFARFVYMNCPSYQTELVIVSGGLEVPEKTVTPEELFAAMEEAAATPTNLATATDL